MSFALLASMPLAAQDAKKTECTKTKTECTKDKKECDKTKKSECTKKDEKKPACCSKDKKAGEKK